ncbi:MAG TPA: STAS domain-containing protein [Candidatus Methylomirabilis sp.]|nr:STAS domain-containing protein [Candidatus Methylomirabilis sp.]
MTANGFAARDNGVFALSGRVTFQTVPQFMARTDDWLQSGTKTVTIDMQGVTLADSAGVALMLEWLQRARAAGRELVFTNLPEQVRQLIHVSGLQQVFRLR